MDFEKAGKHIITQLFGFAVWAGSDYGVWVALHQKPISTNLVVYFLISSSVGAFLLLPDSLYAVGQKLVALYRQWKGGPPA